MNKFENVICRIEKTNESGKQKKYLKELKQPLSMGKDKEKIKTYLYMIVDDTEKYGIAMSATAAEILYRHAETPRDQIKLIKAEEKNAKTKNAQHIAAQKFIIRAAQKEKNQLSGEVGECAFNSFYNFFQNYVRTECAKSLTRSGRMQSGTQGYSDAIDEAVNSCFLAIIENFKKYDTGKNIAPSSYFSGYIKGAIDDYRSLALGHASKTTFQIDRKIKRAMNKLQAEKNAKPNVAKLAKETGFTIDQVQLSLGRLDIINNTASLDGNAEQFESRASNLDTPEQTCIKKENSSEMCQALSRLNPMEQKTLSFLMGIEDVNGELMNAPVKTISEAATLLGIPEKEVNRYHASATKKLKVILSTKEKKEEVDARILERHEVIFNDTEEDEEVKSVIDTIIEIED